MNYFVDDEFAVVVGVDGIINGGAAVMKKIVQRFVLATVVFIHVITRQDLVPRISFHAKFEIIIPDVRRNGSAHGFCGHVVEELFSFRESFQDGEAGPAAIGQHLRKGIPKSLVIARQVGFHVGDDGREDIVIAAMWRQEHLDAGAGGLDRLDEDEFVFVRNDHTAPGGVCD